MAKHSNLEKVEKIAGIITPVITLIAVLIGINQYNRNNKLDFRKNFFDEQVTVYNELVSLSGRIANYDVDSLETTDFRKLSEQLENLYYGRLNLYQNDSVELYVSNYMAALERFKRYDPDVTNEEMRNMSFLITQTCRNSIHETYDLDIENTRPLKSDQP